MHTKGKNKLELLKPRNPIELLKWEFTSTVNLHVCHNEIYQKGRGVGDIPSVVKDETQSMIGFLHETEKF